MRPGANRWVLLLIASARGEFIPQRMLACCLSIPSITSKLRKMSPEAQHLVVVGTELRLDLDKHDFFKAYFEDKRERIKFIENIDKLDFEDYNLSTTIFIVDHFDVAPNDSNDENGRAFRTLTSHNCCIMGSIALLQLTQQLGPTGQQIKMIPHDRPLHNLAMQDALITFSGIASKDEAQLLLTLTRYMGAKSREDVTCKTTHLVAGKSRGFKYRRALELGCSIVSIEWVKESFEKARTSIEFNACKPDIIQQYRLRPFHGLNLAFYGFSESELDELTNLTVSNAGTVVETSSPLCTHIIVEANDDESAMVPKSPETYVIHQEWFWASLEMEGKANEDVYAVLGTRRSSRMDRNFNNMLSPMLDYSMSPSGPQKRRISEDPSSTPKSRRLQSELTARHRVCMELLQTERNYVRVLEIMVNLFESIRNDTILPATDVKIIFGNLTPIYEVHKRMLGSLEQLIENDWSETNCIGKVFVSNSTDLLKAYPPFVNFYEDTKKTIEECDLKYPRFHAFLKRCQSRVECNRESLTEMMIRPVQRLPSISLIINEMLKRTDDSNPDKKYLNQALESIRSVMNLINEDKRKTESQIAMFDIINSIEGCPPNLLSALRRFVCKVEASILSLRVTLFVFSDTIEICKMRGLRRSQSSRGTRVVLGKKDYKHMDQLQLCDVINVYRECDTNNIIIQARPCERFEKNFRYYPLQMEEQARTEFLDKLANCEVYYTRELPQIDTSEIDFDYANLIVHSMERSRLSRVLSIRQAILSPSIKARKALLYSNHVGQ